MQQRRLAILGLGLIGGSIALAAKRYAPGLTVVGFDQHPATLVSAGVLKAIDIAAASAAEAVRNADLVVIAVPVTAVAMTFDAIAPVLADTAVVTDACSTKQSILAHAQRYLRRPEHFVPAHPMAGKEVGGLANASADLLSGATCVVCRTRETPDDVTEIVQEFWRTLGMRIATLESVAEHDRMIAKISHLPHLLACALITGTVPAEREVAGGGFRDMTRVAAGNPALWQGILLDNAPAVKKAITAMKKELDAYAASLTKPDELLRLLTAAAEGKQGRP